MQMLKMQKILLFLLFLFLLIFKRLIIKPLIIKAYNVSFIKFLPYCGMLLQALKYKKADQQVDLNSHTFPFHTISKKRILVKVSSGIHRALKQ